MAWGARIGIGSFLVMPRIRSGTMRSSAQSPPPTTLPARPEAMAAPPSKKDARYALVTSSAQPLLAL
jgi:hypothetical protein